MNVRSIQTIVDLVHVSTVLVTSPVSVQMVICQCLEKVVWVSYICYKKSSAVYKSVSYIIYLPYTNM